MNIPRLVMLLLAVLLLLSLAGYATAGTVIDPLPEETALVVLDDGNVIPFGHKASEDARGKKFREDALLVKFKPGVAEAAKGNVHKRHGAKVHKEFGRLRMQQVKLPKGLSVADALEGYQADPEVEYAEPDFAVQSLAIPSDAMWGSLWGMSKIAAPQAWDVSTGSSSVVVAVLDTGIDYTHPDLVDNVWLNPGKYVGYSGDLRGIDTFNGDSDPMDDHYHGTHVAGTIGAKGNNGIGVTGVNWNVKLLACKFLGAGGSGYVSGAIECLDYVRKLKDAGVNIVATNNSWGASGYSQSLYDAIKAQGDILFIVAAGNDGADIEKVAVSPAGYPLPNVITVAASDDNDRLAGFSNRGRSTVHLAAPGTNILSTFPGRNYNWLEGTSMAAPHVSGVAALLAATGKDWKQTKNLILAGSDPVAALAGKTLTGRRLNAAQALSCVNRPLLVVQQHPAQLQPGVPVVLSVLSVNCGAPAGPVTVTLPGGSTLQLLDNGLSPDAVAGDGVFSASWTPAGSSAVSLTFTSPAGTSTVAVPALALAETPTVTAPGTLLGTTVYGGLGTYFTMKFAASGGLSPYTWSLAAGRIPAGLVFDAATGEVSGSPLAAGVYPLTVRVTDALGASDETVTALVINDGLRPGWPRALTLRPDPVADTYKSSPILADLDGDGREEIVVADLNSLYVFSDSAPLARYDFPPSVEVRATPAVAELFNDGRKQIIVSVGYPSRTAPVYAFDKDLKLLPGFPAGGFPTYGGSPGFCGTPLVDDFNRDGNPTILVACSPNNTYDVNYGKNVLGKVDPRGAMLGGWPVVAGGAALSPEPAPVVADLDKDGKLEILLLGSDGLLRVYRKNGTLATQWTAAQSPTGVWPPVVADFDGDGFLEVAVKQSYSDAGTSRLRLALFSRHGLLQPGWPQEFPWVPYGGIIAADVNGNGLAELISNTGPTWSQWSAFTANGTRLPNWPTRSITGGYINYNSLPVTGELSATAGQDVVFALNDYLWAYNASGAPLSGFPKRTSPGIQVRSTPALGDLDGNGRADLVVKANDGTLHVFESEHTMIGLGLQWPLYGRDARHSGSLPVDGSIVNAPCLPPEALAVPASSATGSFTVSWTASAMAGVAYVLERAVNGGPFGTVYSGSALSVPMKGLSNGSYQFRVKAIRSGYFDSPWTTAAPCVVTVTTVDPPASLTVPVTDTDGTFTVSWEASVMTGVTYRLERADNGGAFVQVYSGAELAFGANGLGDGSYVFRVKAVRSGYADSAWVTAATCAVTVTAVAVPAQLAVPGASMTGNVTVNWSASATGGVSYVLQRSLNGGSFSQVYSGSTPSVALTLGNGSHAFRVKAVKSGYVDSPWMSAGPCVVTLVAERPVGLSVPATDLDGAFMVNWGASPTGGVSYLLERSLDGGAFAQVYSGAGLSYATSALGSGRYLFRVKAVKSGHVDSEWVESAPCEVLLAAAPLPGVLSVPGSDFDGALTVSWGASELAGVSYRLERSVNGGAYAQVYSGTGLSYAVSALGDGSYAFRVKAVMSGYLDSAWRTAAPCQVTLTAVAAPAALTVPAASTTGSVTVNWSASVTGGVSYVLQRSLNGGSFSQVYSGSTPSVTLTLGNGSHAFRVKAVKSGYVDSPWMSAGPCVVTLVAERPVGLSVPATDLDGTFLVSWSASATSGVSYRLEQSVNGEEFLPVYSGSALSSTVKVPGNGRYLFRVKAVRNGYVDSAWREAGPCVVTLTAVAAPAMLNVPATDTTGRIVVSWGASSPGGASYRLERSLNGGNFSQVYSGTALSYTASNLVNGHYVFRVKSVLSGYLDSAWREAGPCTVVLTAGEPPALTVPATDLDGAFMVSWNASATSGVSYVLERSLAGGGFSVVYSGIARSYAASALGDGRYVFRVKAVRSGYVDSPWVSVAPCLVTLTVVAAPPVLSVPASNATGSFTVSWGASATSGVTYRLERAVDEGAYSVVYSGTGRSYTMSGLGSGHYTFRVKAVRSGYLDSLWTAAAPCLVTR